MGGDTEVRPSSHHYWEKNKATNAAAGLPQATSTHPPQLYCQQHPVAGDSTRISQALNPIATLPPPGRGSPETDAALSEETPISEQSQEKKDKAEGTILPGFKLYYKVTII